MEDFTTPMMKQYYEIKKQYQDCLLFYRMGDFYELFLEDAHVGANVLDITLTSKAAGKDRKIPMAGVPYHAVDSYLAKLVKSGYKVAICEQVSEPTKYGLVDREVIRIVTPGTVFDEKTLEKKENNFIISLVVENNRLGLAAADISTGQFFTNEYQLGNLSSILTNELARLMPSECILSEKDYNSPSLLKIIKSQKNINIYPFFEWDYFSKNAQDIIKNQFGVRSLRGFGLEDQHCGIKAAGVLIGYLKHTQKDKLQHLKKIQPLITNEYMVLDKSTITNLELFSTIREQSKQGSLINFLDETVTAMGGRMLREWVQKPLLQKQQIINRHDAVDYFIHHREMRNALRIKFEDIHDIERLLARSSVGIGNARDLVNLKLSLKPVVEIRNQLKSTPSSLVKNVCEKISPSIEKIIALIEKTIVEDAPIELKEGGMIKEGINHELDELKKQITIRKEWIEQFEITEKERTGIGSLKVRFNQVFGFYIEISKSNLSMVPHNYLRKQTLVNGERFITHELKEKEEFILTAEEKINKIEYELYIEILNSVLTYVSEIQDAANSIATLDCVLTFAHMSEKYQYCRPTIDNKGIIKIIQGRHPVVETLLEKQEFVPNDVLLNHEDNQLLIITGPNMAGKSVYIRQVAIIVLMAQMGCFVPAREANLGVVDRVFVRSGASDVISSGLSTFMVEMTETAQILNTTTKDSLIIMDEIGRGTSTYDGISIAWAVAEFLATHQAVGPKTLFATHYHELQALEDQYPHKIKNYHMAVEEHQGEPIFLHTLVPKGASHSFGVAVAKLAGVPEEVTTRALEILHNLEKRANKREKEVVIQPTEKKSVNKYKNIVKHLESMNIHTVTPLDALNYLSKLQEKLKKIDEKN